MAPSNRYVTESPRPPATLKWACDPPSWAGITPGRRVARSKTLRPSRGASEIWLPDTTEPMVATTVSTPLALASTCTVSFVVPTSSFTSIFKDWLMSSFCADITVFRKPCASALTR